MEKSESPLEEPALAPPPPPHQPSLSVPDGQPDGDASSCGVVAEKSAPLAAGKPRDKPNPKSSAGTMNLAQVS